jgi:hypothetical protein
VLPSIPTVDLQKPAPQQPQQEASIPPCGEKIMSNFLIAGAKNLRCFTEEHKNPRTHRYGDYRHWPLHPAQHCRVRLLHHDLLAAKAANLIHLQQATFLTDNLSLPRAAASTNIRSEKSALGNQRNRGPFFPDYSTTSCRNLSHCQISQ